MSAERRRPPKARKGRIGGNPLVDEAEHTPPVSPHANAEWRPEQAAPPPEPAEAPAAITSYFCASAAAPGIWSKNDETLVPLASCSSTEKIVALGPSIGRPSMNANSTSIRGSRKRSTFTVAPSE